MFVPPTLHLAPLKSLSSVHPTDVLASLTYLRDAYTPDVHGSKRKTRRVVFRHEPYSTAVDVHDDDLSPFSQGKALFLDAPSHVDSQIQDRYDLRNDRFERSYSIRWITALIVALEGGLFDEDVDLADVDGSEAVVIDCAGVERGFQEERTSVADSLMQEAASLLALCSGTAGAGKVTRDFFFRSPILAKPVRVQLQDDPLDNHDYSSVGAQTWGGACVLSADIVEHPERFGLSRSSHQIMDIPVNSVGEQPLRVLELGAGTGLVSLTVGKMLKQLWGENAYADIVATDFYPSVLVNLERNITHNFASTLPTEVHVDSTYLDWSECSQNTQGLLPPLDTPFDVVFGADIIYEDLHARWIKGCLERLLRRPQPGASSRTIPAFHLVIPLRKTHTAESRTIEDVFTFAGAGCNGEVGEDDAGAMELCITRKEIITCDGGDGSDDVDYVYYCIQWS